MDQTLNYTQRIARLVLLLAATALLGGCQVFGLGAQAFGGGSQTVAAEYNGLAGRTVAVLVAADEGTLYANPQIAADLGRIVSSSIASNVDAATLMDPQQVEKFQDENPFWFTVPPNVVRGRLGVQRLVIVDVIEFKTHEPGAAHAWQGVMSANVDVIEAESPDANNAAYRGVVAIRYPPGGKVGVLDVDAETMRFAMYKAFAAELSNLFSDHEVVRW